MKAMIDTNVILDVLLKRGSFFQDSSNVLKKVSMGFHEYISAAAVTDIYYIAYKELRDKEKVKSLIKKLLQIVRVENVNEADILAALDSDWSDFEDSVQNAITENNEYDLIITRNPSDYKKSQIQVLTPKELLESAY